MLPPQIAEDENVIGSARFIIDVVAVGEDPEDPVVKVFVAPQVIDGEEPGFGYWMAGAEYFVAVTATRSGAGFEKAIELLTEGAMSYRHLGKVDRPDDCESPYPVVNLFPYLFL